MAGYPKIVESGYVNLSGNVQGGIIGGGKLGSGEFGSGNFGGGIVDGIC